jgi:hypothetical protein
VTFTFTSYYYYPAMYIYVSQVVFMFYV